MNEQNEAREEIFAKHISRKDLYPQYVKSSCKSIAKTFFLNGQKKFEKTLHKRSINGKKKKKAPEKMFYINRHQKNEN